VSNVNYGTLQPEKGLFRHSVQKNNLLATHGFFCFNIHPGRKGHDVYYLFMIFAHNFRYKSARVSRYSQVVAHIDRLASTWIFPHWAPSKKRLVLCSGLNLSGLCAKFCLLGPHCRLCSVRLAGYKIWSSSSPHTVACVSRNRVFLHVLGHIFRHDLLIVMSCFKYRSKRDVIPIEVDFQD